MYPYNLKLIINKIFINKWNLIQRINILIHDQKTKNVFKFLFKFFQCYGISDNKIEFIVK